MLILTRRIGETIMIGDDVAITILGIQGGQTRIGIDAPKDISVHRQEIYNRIQQENNPGWQPEPGNAVEVAPAARAHKTSITIRSRNRFWANSEAPVTV